MWTWKYTAFNIAPLFELDMLINAFINLDKAGKSFQYTPIGK